MGVRARWGDCDPICTAWYRNAPSNSLTRHSNSQCRCQAAELCVACEPCRPNVNAQSTGLSCLSASARLEVGQAALDSTLLEQSWDGYAALSSMPVESPAGLTHFRVRLLNDTARGWISTRRRRRNHPSPWRRSRQSSTPRLSVPTGPLSTSPLRHIRCARGPYTPGAGIGVGSRLDRRR